MNQLPENFEMDKYGLHLRLVNENDAEFILSLRTDPNLTKYIHDTENNVEKQREWIRKYKEREAEGKEYYFIFYYQECPVGLDRIYSIKEDGSYTSGSWVFSKKAPLEIPILAPIIVWTIAFEVLDLKLDISCDGCNINNKKVLKFNKMMGVEITGEINDVKGKYITFQQTKESFIKSKKKIERLFNLK